MPAVRDPDEARQLISRRHPEYVEYLDTTRWILDTLESGETYRTATYGTDRRGKPVRNLLRHKREYPDASRSLAVLDPVSGLIEPIDIQSPVDAELTKIIEYDYELRIARTPVPRFLASFIERQLAKIYKRPIVEKGPADLMEWSDNIDGRETTLQEWMQEVIAPLVCALGMIDVQFGHPQRDDDEPILFGDDLSDADQRCVVSYILPENLPWWRPDYTGKYYVEALVIERHEEDGRDVKYFRHWTNEDWTLYDAEGNVIDKSEHTFGVVPIVRLFDKRDLRLANTANSRMWGIVDKSRAYYNEESELIANNNMHNVPLLEGPGDDTPGARDSVPIGRYYMLRKVVDRNGTHVGHNYVSPPTNNIEFNRMRLFDLVERMEREAALTRTVGSVGTNESAGPVAQSGISKAYDQVEGSEYLSGIAKMLQSNHYTIMYFALVVLRNGYAAAKGAGGIDEIQVIYPKEFNLLSFDQFAAIVDAEQKYVAGSLGCIPAVEEATLRQFARFRFPDAAQEDLQIYDLQIEEFIADKVKARKQPPPAPVAPPAPLVNNPPPLPQPGQDGKIAPRSTFGRKVLKA